jgi:hypothetical protein
LTDEAQKGVLHEILGESAVATNHSIKEPEQVGVVAFHKWSESCLVACHQRLHEFLIGQLHPIAHTLKVAGRFAVAHPGAAYVFGGLPREMTRQMVQDVDLEAWDCWFAPMQLNSVRKPPPEFK